MNNVEYAIEVVTEYFGGWFFPMLAVLGAAVLLFKGTKKARIYTGASLILLLLVYSDLFYGICKKAGMGSEYYRFLWILPVIPLGAVFLAKCREKIHSKILQGVFLILVFALAFSSGNTYLTREEIALPENKYGVSDSILEVIQALKDCREMEEPVILCDEFVALRIRQLDPTVRLSVKRNGYLDYARGNRVRQIAKAALDMTTRGAVEKKKQFRKFLKRRKVDYVILSNTVADEAYMEKFGCIPVSGTGEYTIFKVA